MTIIGLLSILCAVIGAIVYLLPVKAEVKELARLTFFAGLLVVLLSLAGHVVRIGVHP